jgi:hypothetical protein
VGAVAGRSSVFGERVSRLAVPGKLSVLAELPC